MFKTFVELCKKKRTSTISYDHLYKALPSLSVEDVDRAVKDLDQDGKLFIKGDIIHQL